jgi:hypothetical protein
MIGVVILIVVLAIAIVLLGPGKGWIRKAWFKGDQREK